MDRFSYFIIFYSMILGLALAELLGGFALMVRSRALKKLEPQTALMAIVILLCIVTQWIDTWDSMKSVTIDLAGLGASIALAICYYLAAAVVFPHREAEHERLAEYYRERRAFIVLMVLIAVLLDNVIYEPIYSRSGPAVLAVWLVAYNLAFLGAMIALLIFRSRAANIAFLAIAILLLTLPYWTTGFAEAIARYHG